MTHEGARNPDSVEKEYEAQQGKWRSAMISSAAPSYSCRLDSGARKRGLHPLPSISTPECLPVTPPRHLDLDVYADGRIRTVVCLTHEVLIDLDTLQLQSFESFESAWCSVVKMRQLRVAVGTTRDYRIV